MKKITSLVVLFLAIGCVHKEPAADASIPSIYDCHVNPYQLDIKILATNPGSAIDEAMFITNRLHLSNYSVYCTQEVENAGGQK